MSPSKAPDPNGLFRCRYCKKCVKGVDAFILHKRENHGQEIQKRKLGEGEVGRKDNPPSRNASEALPKIPEKSVTKHETWTRSSSTTSLLSFSSVTSNPTVSVRVEDDSVCSPLLTSDSGRQTNPLVLGHESFPKDTKEGQKNIEISHGVNGDTEVDIQFLAVISPDSKELKAAFTPIKICVATKVSGNSGTKVQNPEVSSTARITTNTFDQPVVLRNNQAPADPVRPDICKTTKLSSDLKRLSVLPAAVSANEFLDGHIRSAKIISVDSAQSEVLRTRQNDAAKSSRVAAKGSNCQADPLIAVNCCASDQRYPATSDLPKRRTSPGSSTTPFKRNKKTYKCSTCDEVFSTLRDKNIHIRRLHLSPGLYICKFCSQTFNLERSLIRHKALHLRYSCKECYRRFNSKTDYDIHMKLHHETQKRRPRTKTSTSNTVTENPLPPEPSSVSEILIRGNVHPRPPKTNIPETTARLISVSEAIAIFHQTRIGKDNTFLCSLCRLRLKSKISLRRHLMLHTGERPYKCSFCDHESTSNEHRRKHEEKIHGTALYPCSYCPAKFLRKIELNAHKTCHVGDNVFQCRFCPEAFDKVAKRTLHERRHFFQVSDSNLQSGSVKFMKTNIRKTYKCSYCTRVYHRIDHLKRHEEAHPGYLGLSSYKCKYCDKDFASEDARKYHENTHTNTRPFKCNECPKSFRSPLGHDHHVQFAHIKQVKSKPSNTTQTPIVSNEPPPHPSILEAECGLLRSSNSNDAADNLQTHPQPKEQTVQNVHTCGYCSKTFKNLHNKMYHEKMHTNTKHFKCRACERPFTSSQHLIEHYVSVHANAQNYQSPGSDLNNPNGAIIIISNNDSAADKLQTQRQPTTKILQGIHKCRFCGLTFDKIWNRMYHENTHTGTKPYECEICKKSFTSPQNLSFHHSNAHNCHTPVETSGSGSVNNPSKAANLLPDLDIEYLGTVNSSKVPSSQQSITSTEHRYEADQQAEANNTNAQVTCHVCRAIIAKENLAKHLRLHKLQKLVLLCDTCGKTFSTTWDLERHQVIHARPYFCTYCKRTFDLEVRKEDHVRMAHTKERPFHCHRCQRKFASEVLFLRHMGLKNCTIVSASAPSERPE